MPPCNPANQRRTFHTPPPRSMFGSRAWRRVAHINGRNVPRNIRWPEGGKAEAKKNPPNKKNSPQRDHHQTPEPSPTPQLFPCPKAGCPSTHANRSVSATDLPYHIISGEQLASFPFETIDDFSFSPCRQKLPGALPVCLFSRSPESSNLQYRVHRFSKNAKETPPR